ncbi:peptidase S41, partial [Flavobacterium circumlabens]
AGFAIEDTRISGQQGWVLYPAIYKLFNAADQGNYSMGITPSVTLNEIQNLEIFPLADPREVLIQQALNGMSAAKKSSSSSVQVIPFKVNYNDADPLLKVNFN